MAADKYAQQEYFAQLEEEGHDILILDRYIGSHYVYAEAAGSDPSWIESILQYLTHPDIEIFIDISPETSMKRKGKHGENDRYESDFDLLTRVRDNFLKPRHYHAEGNWPGTIFAKVGGEKTVDDSIEDAYNIVSEYLGK